MLLGYPVAEKSLMIPDARIVNRLEDISRGINANRNSDALVRERPQQVTVVTADLDNAVESRGSAKKRATTSVA